MDGNPRAIRAQQTGENLRAVRTQQTGENLRAVETQQIGVNPMAEVALSNMSASIETRGYTNNVRIGNDEEKSTLGNIFRRLGRGQTYRTR